MIGKNLIHICNYAANYSGNFIASISKLTVNVMQTNRVFFVFPKTAQGKEWLSKLPVPASHIFFCSFEPKELHAMCRKLSKEFSPKNTVIHTHFVDGKALVGVKICFKNVVIHFHMTAPRVAGARSFLKKILMNLVYRNLIVIGVSEAVTHDLKKHYYFSKHECITNAISFEDLEQNAKLSNIQHSIEQGYFSILIHGTHFDRKGVDLAIKALETMETSVSSKCMLYITSHNAESAHNSVSNLKSTFTNIRILSVVEGVKSLYDSVDLFISPSRDEAFGYAVAEASFSECQVLASNIPGQNTMMDIPGIYWVGSQDPESLKNAIEEAIKKKEAGRVVEIKQKQREYVVENYGISKWVDAVMALYDKYFG